jgi:hypothetical protein
MFQGFEVSMPKKLSAICGLVLLLSSCGMAAAKSALPFIEDDYAKALSEARQSNLPLFVEVSAPW